MKKIIHLLAVLLTLILFTNCSTEKDDPVPEIELSPSAKTLYSASVTGYNEVYSEIDTINKEVLLIIPFKSRLDIDKMPLAVNISSNATSNIISGAVYDLTEPFNLEITAEDGSTVNYSITATKCDGNKFAIILSDTQKDVIPLYRQDAFFANVNNVLNKASIAEVDIYYIMLESLKNTDKWDLPDELIYKPGKIIDKPDIVDAFGVKSFHIELLKKGIGRVYIMGVSSMGCVKGTCEGAIANKFELYLVSDAHSEPSNYIGGSRPESSIDECNEIFENKSGVTLILAEDVSFETMRKSYSFQ